MSLASAYPTERTDLRASRLPQWSFFLIAAIAGLLAWAGIDVGGILGGGNILAIVVAALLFVLGVGVAAAVVEGTRSARNRVATALVYSALTLALLPLLSVAFTLFNKGRERLDAAFFQHSMKNITAFDSGGGAYHAIIGTLQQVGLAAIITIPLGILGAIYIVEYGRGRLAAMVRFFVDVMTGIPSIVAGLFILSFWVLVLSPYFNDGRPQKSGFAAALALSVLMLPTVTRSCEEMLRLVPPPLREGSYALGIAKWKTIVKIVLPTALPGIVTGVMLAVARAAGETAPVLLVAGGNDSINTNPFSDQQESLAVYIYQQSGLASKYGPPRAWTAALTLVTLVLGLTIIAKLLARRNKLTK